MRREANFRASIIKNRKNKHLGKNDNFRNYFYYNWFNTYSMAW